MPINKKLRVERMASAGIMLTSDEVNKLADSPLESKVVLGDIASISKAIGREACSSSDCVLECSYIDLFNTASTVDADLIARCNLPSCKDEGVLAAKKHMTSIVTPGEVV